MVKSSSLAHKIPVIGISCNPANELSTKVMMENVRARGAIPRILAQHNLRHPKLDIEQIDGLVLMGNEFDPDPKEYIHLYSKNDPRHQIHPETNNLPHRTPAEFEENKARVAYEHEMIKLAKEKNLPTLGICGGLQNIVVVMGGGIIQHVPDMLGHEQHQQRKYQTPPTDPAMPLSIVKKSTLGRLLLGTTSLSTPTSVSTRFFTVRDNSNHHQAIDAETLPAGLKICAYAAGETYLSSSGKKCMMPEAVEPDPKGPMKDWPMIGTQWHPEFMVSPASKTIVNNFITQAEEYAARSDRDRSADKATAERSDPYARAEDEKTRSQARSLRA